MLIGSLEPGSLEQDSINRGKFKVEIAGEDMPAIQAIKEQFGVQKPFSDEAVLGCVTVTPETASLIIALGELGVKNLRWCSDNQFATDDDVANYLRSIGFDIFAKANMSDKEYIDAMRDASSFEDHEVSQGLVIIDDGCDITDYLIRENPKLLKKVKLITEQTTCGVNKFVNLFDQRKVPSPVVNINNSPAKKMFDNYYGVREAFIHALFNAVPQQMAGKTVSIFGYGQVGEGTAKALKALGCKCLIVEADTLNQVKANFEGFEVVTKETAIERGDIVVLATGGKHVVTAKDFENAKNGAVFCNIGHGNQEFDYPNLTANHPSTQVSEYLTRSKLPNGKNIYSMNEGALVNMISGTGNPPRVMSLTFSLHLLTFMDCLKNPCRYSDIKLHDVDDAITEQALRLNHPELELLRTKLTDEENQYLGKMSSSSLILHDPENSINKRPSVVNIGMFPTRIISSEALDDHTGVRLSLKMECEADSLGAGNKVRKLRYLFPHLEEQGVTDLIMDGTTQSNSCMAVSFYAKRYGIDTHFILSGEEQNQGNHKVTVGNASSVDHIGEWDPDKITQLRSAISDKLCAEGRVPYVVPTGVSNHITAFAGLELIEEAVVQMQELQTQYDHVVLPVGTGSTLAGLEMAQNMYDLPFKIHGAAIANDTKFFRSVTEETFEALAQKGFWGVDSSKRSLASIWEKSIGQGYGVATQDDYDLMKDLEGQSSILFDSVYTFKALQAVRDMRVDGLIEPNSRVLLVHTGGTNERFVQPNLISTELAI